MAEHTTGERRFTGDRGAVGGGEVIPFAVLTFVIGVLLLANAWAVIDTKMATTAAAREAARMYVESYGDAGAALGRGSEAYAAFGRDTTRLELTSLDVDRFERCARVTVTYEARVPAINLPVIGGFGSSFTVTSSHAEIVDPYRSGLPAEGGCSG